MTEETRQESKAVITDAGQQNPQNELTDKSHQHPGGVIPDAMRQPAADGTKKPGANVIYVYAVIAAILGILVGVAVALIAWGPTVRDSPYDLGAVISNADGVTGHLVLTWDQKLAYRLVVEPSDPVRLAGFSLMVNRAPRPLSVDIQLKDRGGSVLCGKTVLLKFDPRQAAALAASDGESQAATSTTRNAPTAHAARALEIAHAKAEEVARENGQDLFQNELGRDGQTDSLTAQGEMPCSKQVFDRAASWNFAPDFLTINEQAELQNHLSGADADTSSSGESTGTSPTSRRKSKRKGPVAFGAFAIEGDDEMVAFDVSKGTMETREKRFFAIDKLSAGNNLAAWQDVPANIHYRCDLNSVCIIERAGAPVLYARLRR